MAEKQTEQQHVHAQGLELRDNAAILAILAEGQEAAARAVAGAVPEMGDAAELMAQTIRNGGRLIYTAAGSSGLMALADALELPGTYGIKTKQIVVLLAGGLAGLREMKGGPEDDGAAAAQEIADLGAGPRDCLIAVTASGQTPYPLEAARAAKAAGARAIGIANNAGARLFDIVDVGICVPTPPEVIAGSTRMGAGTAQKMALNMLSTLMAIRLGHVHDGMMVNVVADNEKLRDRARGIVGKIAGADGETAAASLEASQGSVKAAVLIAAGATDLREAERLLAAHDGFLRPALAALAR